jgi:hypothetical protein
MNLLGLILILSSFNNTSTGTVFQDTFNWGGAGLEQNVSAEYVARQSDGDMISTYDESQMTGAESLLSANNGLGSPSLLQRITEGTVTRQTDVKMNSDFGTGMAGTIWSVLYAGRMTLQNADDGITGWTGFVVESGATAPVTPNGGDFGVIFHTEGSYQVFCDGVSRTNATITGTSFAGTNYEVEVTFFEPSGSAVVRFSMGGTSYDLGSYAVDWDNTTSRKIEFRTQVSSDASPAGYLDVYYDDLTVSVLPRVKFATGPEIKIARPKSSSSVSTNWAYDYAPSAMNEGGTNKVWWAGPVEPGTTNWCDTILYATCTNDPYLGSWSSSQIVFSPSRDLTKFDRDQTCDPSVIRHTDGTYFMYYGGVNYGTNGGTTNGWQTAIGYATSPDGISWTRQNSGKHIIQWESPLSWGFLYGAGQPSVTKRGDYYYMIYTSVKWADSNAVTKVAGEYVIRSTDPHFAATNSVQELQNNGNGPGWVTINRGPGDLLQVKRSQPILGLQSSWDIVYLEDHDLFMVYAGAGDNTKCYFMNDMFEKVWVDAGLFISGKWFKEQRSVIASPQGSIRQAMPGVYSFDLMAATYIDKDGTYALPSDWVSNIFFYDIGDQAVELKLPPAGESF